MKVLKVDGGASMNDYLMQLQSDLLGISLVRPAVSETTSLGAAFAAGLAVGFWNGTRRVEKLWKADRVYKPKMNEKGSSQILSWVECGRTQNQGLAKRSWRTGLNQAGEREKTGKCRE